LFSWTRSVTCSLKNFHLLPIPTPCCSHCSEQKSVKLLHHFTAIKCLSGSAPWSYQPEVHTCCICSVTASCTRVMQKWVYKDALHKCVVEQSRSDSQEALGRQQRFLSSSTSSSITIGPWSRIPS
jgi:hypothetical protein